MHQLKGMREIIKNKAMTPSTTCYIGDRIEDFEAAVDNKLKYIMVGWGFEKLNNYSGKIATSSQDLYSHIVSNC